ncbi:MAG: nucleotidyl transferase AbiEii/AbiGii toxin family protein [Acidobacteriota bacterium]|nr:nucleotidyl transferase AbiEii/AbiGii toxin family protein [Acidobacteriota bacterium]MDW3229940.1 nucleotidyl transferase AbiEii/AbiGii toxin family protein [Acidobacteriota bacterium]
MSKLIIEVLRKKLDDIAAYGQLDAETLLNALKEELQYYVLDFIYHHPEYHEWVMYGGSALHLIHGLDRMSVDLDFEITDDLTEIFLDDLKNDLEDYFVGNYAASPDFLTIKKVSGRGLLLKFKLGQEISFGYPSDRIHVKVDLNHFVAPKIATERRPINHEQLSFIIVTYNMATLMASKIAAILLRGTRGIGKTIYAEKGRDIYDLLWYMNKKVIPDLDYLKAKVNDVPDIRRLFDRLTIQMNKVNDENLKQDLLPLFTNRAYIENWLRNWHETYLQLVNSYKIYEVVSLAEIIIDYNIRNSTYTFTYLYTTKDNRILEIKYLLEDLWVKFRDGELTIKTDKKISQLIKFKDLSFPLKPPLQENLEKYATLFYIKTEQYLSKTGKIMLGESLATKLIRTTAGNLNQKEQIVLSRSTLMSCELEDLLK